MADLMTKVYNHPALVNKSFEHVQLSVSSLRSDQIFTCSIRCMAEVDSFRTDDEWLAQMKHLNKKEKVISYQTDVRLFK